MYYYAMIDNSNIVINLISSQTPITGVSTMIQISEEQYTSGNLTGKYYNASTNEFLDPTPSVLAELSTEQINHGEEWLSDIINKITKKPKRHTASTMTKVLNHGISERIGSLAYGNGVYILVGDTQIYTSTNLATFTPRNTGATGYIFKILFYNGYFFAATVSGEMLKSSDGITWTKRIITLEDEDFLDYQLVATAGKLATITDNGKIYLSSDMGETWTNVYTSTKYTALSYIGNEFILYGVEQQETKHVVNTAVTTGNGATWVTEYTYYDYDMKSYQLNIESNGDYLVGIATGSSIYTSKDGISWIKEEIHKGDHLHMCEFTGDIAYVCVHRGYLFYNDQKCIHDWSMVKLDTNAYIDVAAELNGKLIITTLDNELFIDDAYEIPGV